MRCLLVGLLFWWSVLASAADLELCFNYGCQSRMPVHFSTAQVERVQDMLAEAFDAREERAAIARSVGLMLAFGGEQTPIGADRAGNLADEGVDGRMDCIDHSTNTTALLQLLDAQGWLRFHRVSSPERRSFAIFQHFSAVIEEIDVRVGGRFVVDSWFVEHGEAAIVLPLEDWLNGGGPNVQ